MTSFGVYTITTTLEEIAVQLLYLLLDVLGIACNEARIWKLVKKGVDN
jgi:hypothetical protein